MASGSLTADDLREVAPGVFYADRDVVTADGAVLDLLMSAARASPLRRARLCAHPDPEAEQHDMLIVSHKDTYVAPHRHLSKSETMLVLQGEADALLFDEGGNLETVLPMGPMGSGRTFFYRMPPGRFHGLDIRSEFLVFVESTRGPFRREATEDAPWAPAPDDAEGGRRYVERLRRSA